MPIGGVMFAIELMLPEVSVASKDFTIVGEELVASDIIERMWRKNALMAVVVTGHGVPRGSDVAGVITREHVANSVAEGLKIYPR